MLKIIKWYSELGEETIKSTNLAITKNILISRGQYKGLQFYLQGFGLNKFEREVFNQKFLSFSGSWVLYFGKIIVHYSREGIYDSLRNVSIYIDKPLKNYVTEFINYSRKKLIDKIKHVPFRKQYNFCIDKYFEGDYSFKSDLLSAFQLASNYEADLYINSKLIFSPLAYEWEENKEAIIKYLGKKFVSKNKFNLGYKAPYDKEIKNYKRLTRA